MAGAQFDELRLQVSLVDNATAQLKSIKSSLDELGTGSQANNLDRLKRETGEVDAALRKMVDTALRGPKAFLDLARSVTVAGISLGTFGYAAEKTLGTVSALSSKLVELLHISRQTGFDPAVIKQITQAYERSGLSARQAQQEMAGFSSSLADFAQINSKVRQGIEAGFGNQKELIGRLREMYDAIDRAPDTIGKFNTIKDQANAIFEQFKGRGQETLGKRIRDRILDEFKIPGALNVTESIKPVTDAMTAHLKKQIASAEEYEKVTVRISQNWTAIANTMKFDVMNSGLIKGLKWLDDFMEKWKKAAQAPKAAPKPAAPELTGEPKDAADAREAAARRLGGRRGRGISQPQQAGGGTGGGLSQSLGLDDIPGGAPSSGADAPSRLFGGGTAFNRWASQPGGESTNIEDRRGENLLETQNDETKTLIGEMRRLNALLAGEERPQGQKYGALAMPGGGRAGIPDRGGGYGPSGGGGPPGGGAGTPPGGTTPGGTTQPPTIPGPYGQPMPAWGTTTAGFGGGTGGGAAGGVPGLPGSPSGPALTREQRAAGGAGGAGGDAGGGTGAPITAGKGGYVDKAALQDRLAEHLKGSGLAGYLPPDAARYGLKTGSPQEWAALMTNLAGGESSFRTTTHGDIGQFGGAGSRGLFQLSPNDAITYGIQKTPFTIAQLEDPEFNASVAVKIAAARVRAGGIGDPKKGLAQYFAGAGGRLNRGDYGITPGQVRPARTATGTPETPGPTAGTPQTAPAQAGPPGANDPTVPAKILARARQLAVAGPRAVSDFMRSMGHPKHDAWCGDFAASVVKASGGTPPQNPAIASSWRNWGGQVDDPRPGDIAVRRPEFSGRLGPGTTGQPGSHVTTVESGIDPKTGQFASLGGNQGAIRAAQAARKYQFYRDTGMPTTTQVAGPGAPTGTPPTPTQTTPPDNPATSLYDKLKQLEDAHKARRATAIDLKEARDRIDAMNAKKSVAGTGDISVKVKPERTRTGSSGILKKVPMHRLTQGDKASPGPPQPTAATGASHDPSLDS